MSDLYEQIVNERGSFERLIARIPGFRGYLDNKARRDADRQVRDYVASLIHQQIQRYVRVENALLNSGGFSMMPRTSSIKAKIQRYHDRLKAAAPGYSGFFAAIKIGDQEMESLYAFDELQVRFADKLAEAIDAFEQAVTAKGDVEGALAGVESIADEANDAFSKREDTITALDHSLQG